MIDFSLPDTLVDLKERTDAFIRDKIIPFENDPRQGEHGPSDELRIELNNLAKQAGLFVPHVSTKYGGLGLDHRGKAIVFEAAGYSPLGPTALHIFAPDEGNMHMLEVVANDTHKERWLRPLAAGEIRSSFLMTEPDNGAGSDPTMLATTAVKDGDDYVINGRKWLITGARGAGLGIIMARTGDKVEHGRGATMFLTDMDRAGIEIVRDLDTLDRGFTGGHSEILLNDVRIPASDILGEIDEGYRYAQVRLGPARLTHCMRWLGAMNRAHDTAVAYAARREGFGRLIGHHEGVGFQLADNEMDIHMARLVIWQAAWALDNGSDGRQETAMAKVLCSEAAGRVVDRSLQVLGGLGITSDTIVSRIYRDVRPFRIYDGPSEVHRWSIAERLMRQQRKRNG